MTLRTGIDPTTTQIETGLIIEIIIAAIID